MILASILLSVVAGLSCGKRKPPQPPTERVVQRVPLDGNQVGNRIDLVWKMPARNASDSSTLNIDRVDIYRLAEPLDSSLSLNEEQFIARSTRIASVKVTDTDFGLKNKVYGDRLELVGQSARLRYASDFVNKSGQSAAFSNFFLIEPVSNVADTPRQLAAQSTQNGVKLNWQAPESNLDKTTPLNLQGYFVYRANADGVKRLTPKPIRGSEFVDENSVFGNDYKYFLRSVSTGRNGEDIESFNSEVIEVKHRDTFAPAPPEALTIASAPGTISLFFAFNTETDIKGYLIYRSTDSNLAKSRWELLNKEPQKENTYEDKTATSGITYFYYVIAVDERGNRSASSEVVSEGAL